VATDQGWVLWLNPYNIHRNCVLGKTDHVGAGLCARVRAGTMW